MSHTNLVSEHAQTTAPANIDNEEGETTEPAAEPEENVNENQEGETEHDERHNTGQQLEEPANGPGDDEESEQLSLDKPSKPWLIIIINAPTDYSCYLATTAREEPEEQEDDTAANPTGRFLVQCLAYRY